MTYWNVVEENKKGNILMYNDECTKLMTRILYCCV